MDPMTYGIKCANLILDSMQMHGAFAPDEPKSDCCNASLARVGDELFACSTCGQLCSDSGTF
jgi:hypothetical protein